MDPAAGRVMVDIGDARIEMIRRGQGRAILFLHPHIGMHGSDALIEHLARHAEVIAPSHPGFGHSELPRGMNSVDDLSYFYLDLIEQLDLREIVVVGASFGGWIAAEIATKTTERLSRLILIGALGAKFGARDQSDILDIFATPPSRWEELSFRSPALWQRDYASVPDDELTAIARNREATAHFAWNPYMYLGIVAIAQDGKEAMRRAEIMAGYLRCSALVAEPFNAPPGYFSVPDAARMMKARGTRGTTTRDGRFVDTHHGAIEDLVKAGIMFVGTPDDVYRQLAEFSDNVGGLGNFLMMAHAGHMSHEDAVDQLTLFAKEVLPRLQQLSVARQAA